MDIIKNFELENCKNKRKYSIIHKEVPIRMSPDLIRAIEYLLWYVPNISSVQSKENELISNYLYEDFTLSEIKKYMHLKDHDIAFVDEIPSSIEKYYKEGICMEGQKLILSKMEDETKTSSILRHIRNSIAHGYFNIVDDLLVGFDYNIYKDKKICTGIFKIRPNNLLNALMNLNTELTSEKLIKLALETCNYNVEFYKKNGKRNDSFDFFVSKAGRKYIVEVKEYNSDEIISHEFVKTLVKNSEGLYKKVKPVLVINKSFLRKKSKNYLLKHSVIILDVKNIKKLLKGIDILEEIEKSLIK